MSLFGYQLEHPFVLLLLLLLVPGYLYFALEVRKRTRIPYPPLQHKPPSLLFRFIHPFSLTLDSLLILCVVLILAKPYKASETTFIEENGIDILLNVDLSSSMMAKDFTPNRLVATKEIISDFVRRSGGHRIGMVIFAMHVFTLSPFTTDHIVLRELIEGLNLYTIDHVLSGGTAIGDAILRGTEICNEVRIDGRDQIMILLTDGDNNSGIDNELATRYALEHKIKIYTIGIGSTEDITVYPDPEKSPDWFFDSRLVEEPLQKIAEQTGGRYFHAKGKEVLSEIFNEIAKLEQTPLKTEQFKQKKYKRHNLVLWSAVLFFVSLLLRTAFIRRPLK